MSCLPRRVPVKFQVSHASPAGVRLVGGQSQVRTHGGQRKGWFPHLLMDVTLTGGDGGGTGWGGRSQQRAEVAPKCRQAVLFIAGYTLPGTAIFTIARSSGLFVMLKRLIGGVGTELGGLGGGGEATHGIRTKICPL